MQKLIPITIFSIVMALLSHRFSEYDYINYRYVRKEKIFYIIMSVAMILFVGLRENYNDTYLYVAVYEQIPEDANLFAGIDWLKIGDNPGYNFAARALKRIGLSTQNYLMFYAAITVGINLWFIRKYSCNIPLSIFLFSTFAGYIFTLAALKQCMSMALCMVATDRAIRKKYIPFVVYILIAMAFHPYAFMYLVVPFLMFRPWSGKTVVWLVTFGVLGISLQTVMGTLVNITDMLGEGYDVKALSGEGVNPIRLLVTSAPMFLSLVAANQIAEEKDEKQYLMLNLTMLNAEIMFVALFGTAIFFARLANYFLPFQALAIPWLMTHFKPGSKRFMTILVVCCHLAFHIYSNAINESFDANFFSITLWEYFESLFTGGA